MLPRTMLCVPLIETPSAPLPEITFWGPIVFPELPAITPSRFPRRSLRSTTLFPLPPSSTPVDGKRQTASPRTALSPPKRRSPRVPASRPNPSTRTSGVSV